MLNSLMELLFGDGFYRTELVHTRIVDEDIETAVILNGCVDDALRLSGFGNVAFHRDGFATVCGDRCDHGVRACLAGGIVYDDRRAFRGERLGDGGSDALGRARHDCDFTCELAHVRFPLKVLSLNLGCEVA